MSSASSRTGRAVYRPVEAGGRSAALQAWYLDRRVGPALFAGLGAVALLVSVLFVWWSGILVGLAVLTSGALIIGPYGFAFSRRVRAARAWERVVLPDDEFAWYEQLFAEVASLRRSLVAVFSALDPDEEFALRMVLWRIAGQLDRHGQARASLSVDPALAGIQSIRRGEMEAAKEAIETEAQHIREASDQLHELAALTGPRQPDPRWETLKNRLDALNIGLREFERLGLLPGRPGPERNIG